MVTSRRFPPCRSRQFELSMAMALQVWPFQTLASPLFSCIRTRSSCPSGDLSVGCSAGASLPWARRSSGNSTDCSRPRPPQANRQGDEAWQPACRPRTPEIRRNPQKPRKWCPIPQAAYRGPQHKRPTLAPSEDAESTQPVRVPFETLGGDGGGGRRPRTLPRRYLLEPLIEIPNVLVKRRHPGPMGGTVHQGIHGAGMGGVQVVGGTHERVAAPGDGDPGGVPADGPAPRIRRIGHRAHGRPPEAAGWGWTGVGAPGGARPAPPGTPWMDGVALPSPAITARAAPPAARTARRRR